MNMEPTYLNQATSSTLYCANVVEAQLDGPNMEKAAIPTSRKSGPTMMHDIHVRMSDARENINCKFAMNMDNLLALLEAENSQHADKYKKLEEIYERKIVELKEDNEKKLELMRKEFVNKRANLAEDTLRKILEKLPPKVARMVLT
ncbi:hypothetical protein Tco_1385998 [Tanacetum coccineum]